MEPSTRPHYLRIRRRYFLFRLHLPGLANVLLQPKAKVAQSRFERQKFELLLTLSIGRSWLGASAGVEKLRQP